MTAPLKPNESPDGLAGQSLGAAPGSAIDATITVKAYRDSKGNPACARNFETGEVCIFYRTQRFGCHETCVFGEMESKYMESIKRRGGGDGSLIPLSRCPIWPNSVIANPCTL